MGGLWVLVCHLRGQLLKIQAWGQVRGWREEQDNPLFPQELAILWSYDCFRMLGR